MTELELREQRDLILHIVFHKEHITPVLGVYLMTDKQASRAAKIFQNILTALRHEEMTK